MNRKVISFVKYNKLILKVYKILGNLGASILKMTTKPNEHTILFMSFGGQRYDDSPRAIYEAMKKDSFFNEFDLIWVFNKPDEYSEIDCKKVKNDSLTFYKLATSSKYWIHNSSMERGLNLKRNNTFELNTNHGTPLKLFGTDLTKAAYSSYSSDTKNIYHCAQSVYERDIYARCENADPNKFLLYGLPRNDSLTKYSDADIRNIKNKLNIPTNKKVILYAPTFREYERDEYNACFINPPIDLNKWKQALANDYIILFRAHYEVINVLGITDDGFIFNVSNYPYLNDLLIVSDMMISDYSSIYFDYSILNRPLFNFSYDYDVYMEKRGLYLDLNKDLPCRVNRTEDELLDDILNRNISEAVEKAKAFHNKYATFSGNASKAVVDFIREGIKAGKF